MNDKSAVKSEVRDDDELSAPVLGNEMNCLMQGVLCVSHLQFFLMSMAMHRRRGLHTTFTGRGASISKNGNLQVYGKVHGILYVLNNC